MASSTRNRVEDLDLDLGPPRRRFAAPVGDTWACRIARAMRASRVAAGFTQVAMAEVLDLGVRTIQRYESGRRAPSSRVLSRWIEITGDLDLDAGSR